MGMIVHAAVEGMTDAAVVRRLLEHVGAQAGEIYERNGKEELRKRVAGYNNDAERRPWLVLVDLDHDADCAPPLRALWLSKPASKMCFRVAVRAVEAWLLADIEKMAAFLGVRKTQFPPNPEELDDPKRTLVDLARKSRRKAIQEDMVPRPGSGRSVGPRYVSRLFDFIEEWWRPHVAAQRSESLRRTLTCLERLVGKP